MVCLAKLVPEEVPVLRESRALVELLASRDVMDWLAHPVMMANLAPMLKTVLMGLLAFSVRLVRKVTKEMLVTTSKANSRFT